MCSADLAEPAADERESVSVSCVEGTTCTSLASEWCNSLVTASGESVKRGVALDPAMRTGSSPPSLDPAAEAWTVSTRPTRAMTASASSSLARSTSRSRCRSRSRLAARLDKMSFNFAAEMSSRARSSTTWAGGCTDDVVSVEARLSTDGVRVKRSGALALAELLPRPAFAVLLLLPLPNHVDFRCEPPSADFALVDAGVEVSPGADAFFVCSRH